MKKAVITIFAFVLILGGSFTFYNKANAEETDLERAKLLLKIYQLQLQVIALQEKLTERQRAIPVRECAQINVSWEESDRASDYKLYRDGILIYEGRENEFIDSGLVRGNSYNYSVQAINRSGESGMSNIGRITARNICTPKAPELRGISKPCGGNVSLKWSRVPYAEQYRLFQGRSLVYQGPALGFTDKDLRVNSNYTYYLSAGNTSGWSERDTLRIRSSDICPPEAPGSPGAFRADPGVGAEAFISYSLRSSPRDGTRLSGGSRSRRGLIYLDIEAVYSDVHIRRVKVSFDSNPVGILDTLEVNMGGRNSTVLEINRENVQTVDRGSHYMVTFNNIFLNVPEDSTKTLRIRANALNDAESGEEVAVFFENRAIRATDEASINHFFPRSGGGVDGEFRRNFEIR